MRRVMLEAALPARPRQTLQATPSRQTKARKTSADQSKVSGSQIQPQHACYARNMQANVGPMQGNVYHVDVEPAIIMLGYRVWSREVS